MTPAHNRRWLALALLCSAFFMVILDVSIVNVALPSIQKDLHFSAGGLQWVISAYALTYGGLLLLGGRAADLLGRRRVFIAGVVLFTAASLLCGLSTSAGLLVAARAIQGIGAAIISPAALSIVTTTFEEGAERNKALGIWGAMGGGGAAVGVLMGGVLTTYLGWDWIFFVNVPIGAAVVALSPVLLRESRVEGAHRHYDAAGAATVTSGLMVLVYALVKANDVGWGSARTILLLAAAAALLAAFVVIELRSQAPLMPLSIFRLRTLSGANAVGLLLGSITFAMFFILSLYMQQVLHFSALKTGVGYLATALTAIVSAGAAQALVTRIGVKPALVFGMGMLTFGNVWFTQISVHGNYTGDLLVGLVAIGIGIGFAFVPVSIAALARVAPSEAGLASGLINTSQQIGGGIGIAVLTTVFATHSNALIKLGHPVPAALTSGFSLAFWVAVGLGVAGALAAAVMLRREELARAEEAVTVAA